MQPIHGLHFRNLKGDIYGGVTAAVVALPLALAFGMASGAGAIAGLYGAIFVGLSAAWPRRWRAPSTGSRSCARRRQRFWKRGEPAGRPRN